MTKKRVLWFSRHDMTEDQFNALKKALGDIEIVKINATVPNVHVAFEDAEGNQHKPLKELVQEFDEVAAVLPINLVQQLLPFCSAGRILSARNKRVISEDGTKVEFVFDGWYAIKEVKIVTEDL